MWGKLKTTGDDWMYPKPLMDLRFFSEYSFLQNVLNKLIKSKRSVFYFH